MPGYSPGNYSWAIDGLLAGSSFPVKPEHLQFIADDGVKYMVSLSVAVPPMHTCPELVHVHLPMQDFTPPRMDQIEEFVSLVEKAKSQNEAVAVHCHLGQGRTGTMIACYFVKGLGMTADRAIREIREMRPRSIETSEQEERVHDYEKYLKTSKH